LGVCKSKNLHTIRKTDKVVGKLCTVSRTELAGFLRDNLDNKYTLLYVQMNLIGSPSILYQPCKYTLDANLILLLCGDIFEEI